MVRSVFSATEQKDASLIDKCDLFFHDYSMAPLFNQENYLAVEPAAARNAGHTMELVAAAADSFCEGDLVDAAIRSRNAWGLLPTAAVFASVIPGEYMAGRPARTDTVSGLARPQVEGEQVQPAGAGAADAHQAQVRVLHLSFWLRCWTFVGFSAGVSRRALNEEMAQPLLEAIVRPLVEEGSDGVAKSVEVNSNRNERCCRLILSFAQVMKQYSLLREDLDSLLELCQWPDQDSALKGVEPKVKAAFTRAYNKEIVLPYATGGGPVGRKRAAAASDELLDEEEEDAVEENEEDDDDIAADAMIKAKKPARAKAAASNAEEDATSDKGEGQREGRTRRQAVEKEIVYA